VSKSPALLLLLLALACGGCRRSPAAGAGPLDAGADEPPAPVRVTAERDDLVFSYGDGDGFRTATKIADVPAGARRQVVVTDLSLSPEARRSDRYVQLVDLSAPRADGSYPVSVASRHGFEATLAATSTVTGASGGVVLYTTAWCGVCKKAKRVLAQLGVPFTEKDIEASRQAREELGAKARAAGISPGGVPVIDVAGTLLQGLDEGALRAALAARGLLPGAGD
jgi:glutaredoxin